MTPAKISKQTSSDIILSGVATIGNPHTPRSGNVVRNDERPIVPDGEKSRVYL